MSDESDPYWYKDAVIYEVNVRAYADSNADGIGDFPGLTGKLDYIRDLGVTAVWLLPFYPSPLRDDGYDISDYTGVSPSYGTMEDFAVFLREAHARGLRVITELVLNHTSDRHPWFERARHAPAGSSEREFYVWSDTPKRYKDARIIFKDFEHSNWTWDPIAKAYFWHRFYSHQPDLNFESSPVRSAMLAVVDFWLGLGIDGLRLDAVPYLYEREGTSCENLPETHAFLKELRAHIDARFKNRMLLAEANQWPEDAASYFGSGPGDECHAAFHFPLMPRMFMALQTEDRFPIVDILEQTPALPECGQWALFLRNHDELTLEMVTDEERDYMYRVYATDPQARINLGIRRRLAPLLSNHRRRIELLNGLLFSLPGTPVIYYGDEIGMGDNFYLGDRNGVRTPMQWNADRNAGFSRANAQKLYLPVIIDPEYHYEAFNVEVQQNNPQSLLWWMKRFIGLRARSRAFGRGALKLLSPENRKVLAFVRSHLDEVILVVANLSRFVQHVELSLAEYAGRLPVEILGGSRFPIISDLPYPVTLGPHDFYWFRLRAPEPAAIAGAGPPESPVMLETDDWRLFLTDPHAEGGAEFLAEHVRRAERLAGRPVPGALTGPVEFQWVTPASGLATVPLEPALGEPLPYLVRLAYCGGERAAEVRRLHPGHVAALLRDKEGGILCDAALDRDFCLALLRASKRTAVLEQILASGEELEPAASWARDGSVLIAYAGRCSLRLFGRLESGVSPDLELSRFLTERARFQGVPAFLGALERARPGREAATLAVIHAHHPIEGYAWQHALDSLGRYFERALTGAAGPCPDPPQEALVDLAARELPARAMELIGPFLRDAELLGRRAAELHLALAAEGEDAAFAPAPFSAHDQRSLYQSMRALTRTVAVLLRRSVGALPEGARAEAQRVLELEDEALRRFKAVHERKLTALRHRCHGNLHLGRVIFTGKDFLITGFEGEPGRSLNERRLKRSGLRDVASMLRSFHYAVYTALSGRQTGGTVRPEDREPLEAWAAYWQAWSCAGFLKGYLDGAAGAPFLPETRAELCLLLDTYLRERAVRELGYELIVHPERAAIPLKGLARLIESVSAS